MADSPAFQKKTPNKITKALVAIIGASSLALSIALVVTVATTASAALQPTVALGTSETYAVMAGAGITNTGATTASGTYGANFGSSPTGTFTGSASVTTTGTIFTADNVQTATAQADLITAYNDAAGRTPATPIAADLGGQVLMHGVYNSASSIGLTGTLTLDGENNPDAVFIFQAGSTLTTASISNVLLINGAQPCNVFWQVGSSATFGTNSDFVGHVLALTSITATTGASFEGSLLARNGAVTLDTNTFVNDRCAAVVTPTPTASVVPTVSATPTATASSTPTVTPSVSATPTVTPSATVSATPTPTSTPVSSPVPAESTPTPTLSASPTPTPTATPVSSPASSPTNAAPEARIGAPGAEASTESGGQLPNTDSASIFVPLAGGLFLLSIGCAVYLIRRRVG